VRTHDATWSSCEAMNADDDSDAVARALLEQAAQEKRKKNKNNNKTTFKLVPFAVTSGGIVHAEAERTLKMLRRPIPNDEHGHMVNRLSRSLLVRRVMQ